MSDGETKKIDSAQFAEFLKDVLPGGAVVPLKVTGSSMRPFLYGGRDTVFLVQPPSGFVKKGDIVLYLRDSGRCVLHRVCKVTSDGFYAVGDAQRDVEGPVSIGNILAFARSAERKGHNINEKSPVWLFYKYIWLSLLPIRHRLFSLVRKIKNKKGSRRGV